MGLKYYVLAALACENRIVGRPWHSEHKDDRQMIGAKVDTGIRPQFISATKSANAKNPFFFLLRAESASGAARREAGKV